MKIDLKESKKIQKYNGINLDKKEVKINKKNYKLNECYSLTSSFSKFDEENIILRNPNIKLRIDIIYHLFLSNVSRFTKLGLILPCFVFLFISLISFSSVLILQNKGNFGFAPLNDNQLMFIYFISIFMFFIFLIYLYKIVIKKEVVFFTKKNGQNRLKHLSKKDYKKMIEIFKKNIEKERNKFEYLESESLIIRQFKETDENDVFEFLSNDNFIRYTSTSKAKNRYDAFRFIQSRLNEYKKNCFHVLAIEKKDENKVIGYIGLSREDYSKYTCEIIYGINEPYWHKGFMSEAVKRYLEYLKTLKFDYIFGGHIKENINSGKVMMKNGFVRYPLKDNSMIIRGNEYEILTYLYEFNKEGTN